MTGYKVTDLSPMVEYDPNDLIPVVDVSTNTTRKYKLSDLGLGNNNTTAVYERQSITSCVLNNHGNPNFISLFGTGATSELTLDILGDSSCTDLFTLNDNFNNTNTAHSNLTNSNGLVTFTPSIFTQGGLFDAPSHVLSTANMSFPTSVSLWFNTFTRDHQNLFNFGEVTINFSNNSIILKASAYSLPLVIPYNINTDQWYNLIFTYDTGTTMVRIYMNGVSVYSDIYDLGVIGINNLNIGGINGSV
jgi:hypothetical protein